MMSYDFYKATKRLETKSNLYSSPVATNDDNIIFAGHDKNVYFFDKRGDAYLYASGGPYFAASFRGIQYDKYAVDYFLDDTDGYIDMYNPILKLGKSDTDDIMAFDYGVNIGVGFGYSNFQIGYNFGLGIANMIPKAWLETEEGEESSTFILRNGYHSVTLGFYFSNE